MALYNGNHWFILGESSPFMAARFRLVKYDNSPRYYGNMIEVL